MCEPCGDGGGCNVRASSPRKSSKPSRAARRQHHRSAAMERGSCRPATFASVNQSRDSFRSSTRIGSIILKKIFAGIVVVIVCAYGGLWLFAAVLHSKSDSNQWPENLGALSDVPNRYAESENNAAANALMKLTMPLGISVTPLERQTSVRDGYDDVKKSISDYVSAQLERASDQSAPPPAAVEAFFAAHQTQIDQVRDHIANAGPIRWQMHFHAGADAPLPNLLGHMSLARLFTARALAKAANHDASAWDDLHVIWQLDNELWNRPELISQLIALAGSRMVNAAAVKMPLPEPAGPSERQPRG